MITDAQNVGNDRQRGVHRSAGNKEGPVDDVEVVDIVGAAVQIQHRCLRIRPEAAGAVLVADTLEGDALRKIELVRENMGAVNLLEHLGPAVHEPLEGLDVVRGVVELDLAVDQKYAVLGIWEVLGGEPPRNGMLGHLLEHQTRGHARGIGDHHFVMEGSDQLDIAHRELVSRFTEIEIIHGEGLLVLTQVLLGGVDG